MCPPPAPPRICALPAPAGRSVRPPAKELGWPPALGPPPRTSLPALGGWSFRPGTCAGSPAPSVRPPPADVALGACPPATRRRDRYAGSRAPWLTSAADSPADGSRSSSPPRPGAGPWPRPPAPPGRSLAAGRGLRQHPARPVTVARADRCDAHHRRLLRPDGHHRTSSPPRTSALPEAPGGPILMAGYMVGPTMPGPTTISCVHIRTATRGAAIIPGRALRPAAASPVHHPRATHRPAQTPRHAREHPRPLGRGNARLTLVHRRAQIVVTNAACS